MTSIQQNFTVLNPGLTSAREFLRPILSKVALLDELQSIEIVNREIPDGYESDPKRKGVVKVSRTFAEQNEIITNLRTALDLIPLSGKEEDTCYVEKTPKNETASLKEDKTSLFPEKEKS